MVKEINEINKESESNSDEVEKPIMKRGATKMCRLSHCMGEPKELMNATTFNGTICVECFATHEYELKSIREPSKAKLLAMKREKERMDEQERLENGLETEAEINSHKQYKSTGPKSKNNKETNKWRKPKKVFKQTNIFGELDDIKKPKKLESKILRLGLEQDKKEKIELDKLKKLGKQK